MRLYSFLGDHDEDTHNDTHLFGGSSRDTVFKDWVGKGLRS